MFQSPHSTASRPSSRRSARHPRRDRGHEAFLLQLPLGLGLAGRAGRRWPTVETGGVDLDVAAVRGELVGARTDPHARERVRRQHGNTVAALEMRVGRRPGASRRPAPGASASASCSSSARVSCRQTTSARVSFSHGSRPRFSVDRSLTAARMPLTLTVVTITEETLATSDSRADPVAAPPREVPADLAVPAVSPYCRQHDPTRTHPRSASPGEPILHAAPVPVLAERLADGRRSARRHRPLRGVRTDHGRPPRRRRGPGPGSWTPPRWSTTSNAGWTSSAGTQRTSSATRSAAGWPSNWSAAAGPAP